MLVALGLAVLAEPDDRPPPIASTTLDAPVNVGAQNPRDISAHNSPTLVRNPVRPANLAVSSRIDTPFFSCGLHVSSDGGESWSQIPIPAPRGEEPKCFAPDVAFSADGTLYLSFVTLKGRGNVPNAVWISTLKNEKRKLSKPVKALGKLAFQVRLAPDPASPKRMYMTWLQGKDVAPLRFTEPGVNPLKVSRTEDEGATWSRPARINDASRERPVAPSPVVGPKGELYVLYLDLGEDRLDYEAGHRGRGGRPFEGPFKLVLGRSEDRGENWEESVVEEELKPIHRFIVFTPAFPSVTVDRSGRIYAAFHDLGKGDADVLLWSLEPGESDWEGPRRVNERTNRTWQYLPKVAAAPNGRLDVVYYDRRADPQNIKNHVSLQTSFDQGKSFTAPLRLSSRPFSSRIGYGAKEGLPDLGSRLGLLSEDQQAEAVWTDTRAGTPGTQKQDLARAVALYEQPPAEKPDHGLRYVALGLGLAGLVLLALWATASRPFRRKRPTPES